MKPMLIKLSEEQHKAIDDYCKSNRTNKTKFIRAICDLLIEKDDPHFIIYDKDNISILSGGKLSRSTLQDDVIGIDCKVCKDEEVSNRVTGEVSVKYKYQSIRVEGDVCLKK